VHDTDLSMRRQNMAPRYAHLKVCQIVFWPEFGNSLNSSEGVMASWLDSRCGVTFLAKAVSRVREPGYWNFTPRSAIVHPTYFHLKVTPIPLELEVHDTMKICPRVSVSTTHRSWTSRSVRLLHSKTPNSGQLLRDS
jgi:hypothetical protein